MGQNLKSLKLLPNDKRFTMGSKDKRMEVIDLSLVSIKKERLKRDMGVFFNPRKRA